MEFKLDVCGLPAPEPMELILSAVQGLKEGDYLKVIHNREPFPIYSMLNDEGFFYHTVIGGTAGFLIFIWRSNDGKAELAVETRIERESQ